MISLDIKSVTDEIFALTALRAAVTGGDGETPPVLTRDNLPSLRVLVRAAFATLAASLGPLVADASVEDGNPAAPGPYDDRQPVTLDIDLGLRAASLTGGTRLVLKRYLEHLLALSVLEKAYLPVDAAIAADHAAEASLLLQTVTSILSDGSSAACVTPCYI